VGLSYCRDNRESEVLKELAELLVTAVEFVISESHGIELERIDSLGDLLRSVVGVEQGALELIASVEPEVVRALFAQLVHLGLDARVATIAASRGICAVCARAGELVQMRVDVVDMEEGCCLLASSGLITQYSMVRRTHVIMALIVNKSLGKALADQHVIGDSYASEGGDSAAKIETGLHDGAEDHTFATMEGNREPVKAKDTTTLERRK
jgi:hypothetical protein